MYQTYCAVFGTLAIRNCKSLANIACHTSSRGNKKSAGKNGQKKVVDRLPMLLHSDRQRVRVTIELRDLGEGIGTARGHYIDRDDARMLRTSPLSTKL